MAKASIHSYNTHSAASKFFYIKRSRLEIHRNSFFKNRHKTLEWDTVFFWNSYCESTIQHRDTEHYITSYVYWNLGDFAVLISNLLTNHIIYFYPFLTGRLSAFRVAAMTRPNPPSPSSYSIWYWSRLSADHKNQKLETQAKYGRKLHVQRVNWDKCFPCRWE